MKKYIISLIYIILLFGVVAIYVQLYQPKTIECFSSKQLSDEREDLNKIIEYPDIYDKTYTRLFNLVMNEPAIYRHDIIKIKEITKLNKESRVLEAGCGLGRHLEIIKELIPDITIEGVDKSKSMINQCNIRNPGVELLCTSLTIPEIYKPEKLTHILSLQDTLHQNSPKEVSTILNNFHKWLIPNGYLIIHIIDPNKLDPRPRAFSQCFKAKDGTRHALTYFESFSHEAWWEKDTDKKNWYSYCQKYIFPNEKIKIQTNPLWLPPINVMLNYITRHQFKLKEIVELNEVGESMYKLYIFKKV